MASFWLALLLGATGVALLVDQVAPFTAVAAALSVQWVVGVTCWDRIR